MDIPNIIKNSHPLKRTQAIAKFKQYESELYLQRNEPSSLLYIGCGNGIAMFEDLIPLLPESILKIVGTDTDEIVIKRAKKRYVHDSHRISFKHMDLLNKEITHDETFDHIISFWCLRWVHDISISCNNIKKLLNTYGSGIFLFESSSFIFNIILAMDYKWRKHVGDILRGASPFQFGGDIITKIRDKLIEAGLYCIHSADLYREKFTSLQQMKEYLDQTYIFSSVVPEHLLNGFYNEIFKELLNEDLVIMDGGVVQVIEIPVQVDTFCIRKPLVTKKL